MKPFKVLFNACMYYEPPPGVGINTREAYNALTQLLEENNIYFKCYAYSTKGLKAPQAVSLIKLPAVLEFLFRRFRSVHRLIWNIFYLPFIAKDYDLVYAFTTYGSPFIKNQIITIHDLICFQYPKQSRFQYIYFKFILPSILRSCKKIVVISEFTKQDVIKHFKISPDKLEVIYCGHDHLNNLQISTQKADAAELGNITGGKSFFLTVQASYPHKNIERIIEAVQVLPGYLLLVTGPNNAYYNQLKKATEKKKYNNIIFLNYVSDSLLKLLYKKCVANIYISSYEGFGAPPLEAAMNDKISVVSNASVLPEIYQDAVLYVNPIDTEEIKKALIMVASPQFDASVYKNKFPALFKKYSWGNMADGIMRVILKSLDKKTVAHPVSSTHNA